MWYWWNGCGPVVHRVSPPGWSTETTDIDFGTHAPTDDIIVQRSSKMAIKETKQSFGKLPKSCKRKVDDEVADVNNVKVLPVSIKSRSKRISANLYISPHAKLLNIIQVKQNIRKCQLINPFK